MARKTPSRLELRKQVEAAESLESAAPKKKKAARKKAATRTRRTREKVPERRKLVWAIFDGSMKEDSRFAFDKLDDAEKRLETLRAKGKKLYFIQRMKEAIAETPPEDD
jgi:hypothetical protein